MSARQVAPRRRFLLLLLTLAWPWLSGCPAASAPDPAEQERLRAQLREELKAELREELRAELQPTQGRGAVASPPGGSTPAAPPPPAPAPPPLSPVPTVTPTPPALPPLPTPPGDEEDRPADPATPPVQPEPIAVPVRGPDPRLVLVEATVARTIEERAPVEPGTRFIAGGEPIYAFAILSNPDGPPTWVRFVWRYQGQPRAVSRVRVGQGTNWRTWAYHAIPNQQLGDWQVEVQTDSGVVLRSLAFVMTAP